MSDILEQLNRRLERKRSEIPTQGSGEASASEPTPSSPPDSPPAIEPRPDYDGAEGDIALVFAPDGPVAHLLGDAYRPRRGQARMARLVERALEDGRHALIEAGTGSGKSFAYLIPLIWTGRKACPERSRRAFVSTANKTLQNQLWEKDLPALQRIAPRPFKAALLKGRSNYVCRVRLKEWRQQLRLPGQGLSVAEVMERLEQTPSGDVEELRLFGDLRDRLTVGRYECLGHRCPHVGRCYYELARMRAEKADVVVLNHALLAFNLVLDHQIVDPRDAIVIDEAHDFVPYVIGALRLRLAYDRVPALVSEGIVAGNTDEQVRTKSLRANQELFTYLAQRDENGERPSLQPRWAAPRDLPLARKLSGHVATVAKQLEKRYDPTLSDENGEDAHYEMTIERVEQLAEEIMALGQPAPDDIVRYCERGSDGREKERLVLCQEPVDVARFLRSSLWDEIATVICTSATLTTGRASATDGAFDHFCRQTGAPREGALKRVIASPFDYADQALLYTPKGLYPRYGEGEDEYVRKLADEVERLVRASRSRAFVLCTSTRRVGQLFDRLKPRLPFTCYRQGMASREELLDSFRSSPGGAVLFATRSFWQGVDIPGEALSLVVIDKLPFAPYRDPVIQYRQRRIREAGGNPFLAYLLPEAILALKQGVGRLIRAETDRGVMAILDSRINTKRYGPRVIDSLPPARQTLQFEDVADFFEDAD